MTGFPKPTKAARLKAKRSVIRAAGNVLAVVRSYVWRRSGGHCEVCGDSELASARKSTGAPWAHHLHELVSRAKTRGRPAADRFSSQNCVRVCPTCHAAIHAHTIDLIVGPDGANGYLTIHRKG